MVRSSSLYLLTSERTIFEGDHYKIDEAYCEQIGRDPNEIAPSCHVFVSESPNETADQAAALVEAGARHVCLYFIDKVDPRLLGPTAEAVRAI